MFSSRVYVSAVPNRSGPEIIRVLVEVAASGNQEIVRWLQMSLDRRTDKNEIVALCMGLRLYIVEGSLVRFLSDFGTRKANLVFFFE